MYFDFLFVFVLTMTTAMLMAGMVSATNSDTLALFQMTGCAPDSEHRCQIAAQVESRFRFIKNNNTIRAELCTLEVGGDNLRVVDMVMTILETGKISFEKGACINETVSVEFSMDKKIILFTYVSHETTRLISSLFTIDNTDSIILVAVTDQAMYPNALLERVTFMYSYEMGYTLEMHKHSLMNLQNHFEISYSAFLYLKHSEEDEIIIRESCDKRSSTAYCFYKEQDGFERKNCYKEKMVRSVGSYKEVMELLTNDSHLRTMVVYGYGPEVNNFRNFVDVDYFYHDNFFLLPFERPITNSSIEETKKGVSVTNKYWFDKFPGQNAINGLLYYVYNYKEKFFTDFQIFKALKTTGMLQAFAKNNGHYLKLFGVNIDEDFTFDSWKALGEVPPLKIVIMDTVSSWNNIKKFLTYFKVASYMSLLEPERLLNSSFINPKKALEADPYCRLTVSNCSPGKELHHSSFKETNWDNSYGWHCRKCLLGTYKNVTGNSSCVPCHYPFTTDSNGTSCFDPFAMRHLTWNGTVEIVALTLSTLTGTLVLLTSGLFVKYKNTPVIRHTNLPMSALQLFLHFLLSFASFVLFVTYPGKLVCTLRPLVVGLCLTINTAVNIGKTQKLYVIFNSKTRHSTSERRLIKRLDWLIIAMVTLVDVAIFIVFNVSGETKVLLTYHDTELVKEATCSNNMDIIIQLLFLLSLIFVNGVNAFKARQLPSYFKETTHVIYSSFTSVVSLSGLMAIYFTQRKMLAKEMMLMVFVIAVNLMHFLLIYSYKVFVIVFRPKQNTAEMFNIIRQKKMQEQF